MAKVIMKSRNKDAVFVLYKYNCVFNKNLDVYKNIVNNNI